MESKRGRIAAPVKYWKTALSIFALSASLALAEDFRTTKGKEYKNATVSRVEPDGIVIKVHGGIVKLPFTELPSDVQKKYEYDPVAAREYAAQRDRVIPRPTATPDANLRTSEADDAQSSVKALNRAEEFVVKKATTGEMADLNEQFPEEKDRKLSAKFVQDLVTGTLPNLKLHRHGVQINGAIIDDPIELENARIPCQVRLEKCQFNANITFARADFARALSLKGSRFKEAHFNGIKAGDDAVFDAAIFEGSVSFLTADIAGNFKAVSAKFHNKHTVLDFRTMKIRGDAALFDNTVFEGSPDFEGISIARNFQATGAKFENENTTKFRGMKVGGDALFDTASFEGPVDFSEAEIASNFHAASVHFNDKKYGANFRDIKVRGGAYFFVSLFAGPVDFRNADFGSLDLSDVRRADVPAQFRMVGNDVRYIRAEEPARFQMQGMSYDYIRAALEEPESHNALLALADHSVYSADVYHRLEEFFARLGYRADADKAFIAGKRRERKAYFHDGDWFGWLRSWMLYLLVGYGRQSWRAIIPCAVLIALGCILFSPNKMEPQKPEDVARVYSRFWYSLGLFLPFVDLQADKVWKPKADQTFLRNYMRVHIMLGWILVPLVLAALTGLIK